MKIQKYIAGLVLAVAAVASCSPDESLYPLPYDDRATGSYLRAYRIISNTWDLDDIDLNGGANSGFEVVFESVDKNYGADLVEIRFYATFRIAASGRITDEILVKTLDASDFSAVPEPTYSEYLRSTPIRITYQEVIDQLNTLTTDPDGTTCSGIFPDVCNMEPFPVVAGFEMGDRVIFRVAIEDNQGRTFTVANPQTTVTPAQGNPNEANITTNLAGGLFYASPMLFTTLVTRTTSTGNQNAYTGTYIMTQRTRWQPDHSVQQHLSFPQGWIDEFAFGNPATGSDSSQIVTLAKVPGGLPTQRQFTARYRGEDINIMINLEMVSLPAFAVSATAFTTMTTALPHGYGFPGGSVASGPSLNLGYVTVPLSNTGVDCNSERQFYQVTPLTGSYDVPTTPVNLVDQLPWGLPRRSVPNRGAYRFDRDGQTVGDRFTIVLDDDSDEYGRRNGYCNWYTRIALTLEKN